MNMLLSGPFRVWNKLPSSCFSLTARHIINKDHLPVKIHLHKSLEFTILPTIVKKINSDFVKLLTIGWRNLFHRIRYLSASLLI